MPSYKFPACLIAGLMLLCSSVSAYDLSEIHRLALDNDPVLRSAEAVREAEFEAKPQSRALLRPTILFDANHTRGRERIIANPFSPALEGTTSSFETTGISLSLNQPLYNREFFVRLRQADSVVARADADYRAAEQALMVRVAQAYFDLLAARDGLEFAAAEKEAIERQLEQADQRFEVGLVAITDVHEARAAFDLATAAEIEAQNLVENSKEVLYEIAGRVPGQIRPLTREIPLERPDPADIDQWVAIAMEQNFALLAAQFGEEIARDGIDLQRAGHHPRLDFIASLSRTESDSGSFGGRREFEEGVLGLRLVVPLYEGNAVTSRTREAGFVLTQAKQEVERQRRAALRQTRDAYLSVIAAINRVNALAQARISARSALDATEAGFDVGTRTTVDVLLARSDLFEAERGYSRARYDYVVNILLLKEAAGILTVSDIDQINRWLEG